MDDLWQAVAEIALELSPDRVESAAAAIAAADTPEQLGVTRTFGPNLPPNLWRRFQDAWQRNSGVSTEEVAAALRTGWRAGELMSDGQALDLVWTGPKTDFVPVRSTEQVMLEVIQRAEESLFLVSFVNHGAWNIVNALNEAASRGVAIKMLLEETKGAVESLQAALPAATFYVWDEQAKEEHGNRTALVHAKCIVADGREAFITSANLTTRALEGNMELGIHIMSGREPQRLSKHLDALVSTKKVQRIV